MFNAEQILQEFVDAATMGSEFAFLEDGYGIVFENDETQLVRRRRPEFLKERVAEILPQRDEWTTRTLSHALEIPYNLGEAYSLALIMHELGWQSRKRGAGNRAHFRKSFADYKGRRGPPMFIGRELEKLRLTAAKQALWYVDDLCQALELEASRKNKCRIGVSMRLLGYQAKLGSRPSRPMKYLRTEKVQ